MKARLDAALAYAGKGWAVLPLRGKLPAIAKPEGGRGVHDATTDKDTIKAWWAKWPAGLLEVAGEPDAADDLRTAVRASVDRVVAEVSPPERTN